MQVLGVLIVDDYGEYAFIPANTHKPRQNEAAKSATMPVSVATGIVSPPNPDQERADRETAPDLSLGGIIKKNTKEE